MPYIEVKLSVNADKNAKVKLQEKLTKAMNNVFSKPISYIMVNIEDNQSLYMGEKNLSKGAYISVKSLGNISKPLCASYTKIVCDILKEDFEIEGNNVYISYHPVELWGFNGSMF